MLKTLLPYGQVPQLAKTDVAYATGDTRLAPFYTYSPRPESFSEVLHDREKMMYPRADLVQVLTEQYQALPKQALVHEHIEALRQATTFTVITAHQPSLLLGPLFFLYKAVTTINLAKIAEQENAGRRVVPVFVLGSEDHDLEELNSIHLYGKKLTWASTEQGAVGSMHTAGLAEILAELKTILGESEAAQTLFARVERAYTEPLTLVEATRAMLHELFGRYGLVVVDLNDARLKRHFIPVMRAELLEQPAFRLVNSSIEQLNAAGFKTQAAPREINLFYMQPGQRNRITLAAPVGSAADTARHYQVLNTEITFTEAEILTELDAHPERISPNVVLRPLMQESILPNLAYVGGGGELAYWLERKALFAHFQVPFPMLLRRNSVLWVDRELGKKLAKLQVTALQLFEDIDTLVRNFVAAHSTAEVHLAEEIAALRQIFD
ncbi:MAG: bacillithiol biosynthesis cysteine-adding enzyme BshC, partial [Saprospiraceae bacterium]|nr:bacillithiol biosynthesis cysteine-adding enzyme BshC [Saprospiraceae bacterium]